MQIENEWEYWEMENYVNIILEFYDHGDYGIRLSLNNYVDVFALWVFDISDNNTTKYVKPDYRFKISVFGFSLVF